MGMLPAFLSLDVGFALTGEGKWLAKVSQSEAARITPAM